MDEKKSFYVNDSQKIFVESVGIFDRFSVGAFSSSNCSVFRFFFILWLSQLIQTH